MAEYGRKLPMDVVTAVTPVNQEKLVAVVNHDPKRSFLVTGVVEMFQDAAILLSRRGGKSLLTPVRIPSEPPTIREHLERLRLG